MQLHDAVFPGTLVHGCYLLASFRCLTRYVEEVTDQSVLLVWSLDYDARAMLSLC